MKKKHYKFVILIIILIILLYEIITYKYKQYQIEQHINSISKLNKQIELNIQKAKEIIEYKKSKAYKNKVLKRDKWLKNKKEVVVYLTTEDNYNMYIKKEKNIIPKNLNNKNIKSEIYWMTTYQKWIYFLFKKDLR